MNSKAFQRELVTSVPSKPMKKVLILGIPNVLLLPQD